MLDYGRWADWQLLVAHYGKPRLADLVAGLRSLQPRAWAFCCAWFQLRFASFRSSAVLEPMTPLRSLPDLAAMKLNAIANRGSKKDFFDLAELLNHQTIQQMIGYFTD